MGVENMANVFYYDYVTIEPRTYFLTASEFGLTYVGLISYLQFLSSPDARA
jgi:methylated-DNA-[protein]-cysteine S-methyltransferase